MTAVCQCGYLGFGDSAVLVVGRKLQVVFSHVHGDSVAAFRLVVQGLENFVHRKSKSVFIRSESDFVSFTFRFIETLTLLMDNFAQKATNGASKLEGLRTIKRSRDILHKNLHHFIVCLDYFLVCVLFWYIVVRCCEKFSFSLDASSFILISSIHDD